MTDETKWASLLVRKEDKIEFKELARLRKVSLSDFFSFLVHAANEGKI